MSEALAKFLRNPITIVIVLAIFSLNFLFAFKADSDEAETNKILISAKNLGKFLQSQKPAPTLLPETSKKRKKKKMLILEKDKSKENVSVSTEASKNSKQIFLKKSDKELNLNNPLASLGVFKAKDEMKQWALDNKKLDEAEFVKDKYGEKIKFICQEQKFDEKLAIAIITVESGGDPKILGPGGHGLMQLGERTARKLGVLDIFDPYQNIWGGIKYMKILIEKFEGSIPNALWAYNWGPEKAMFAQDNGLKNHNIAFVNKVMYIYETLKQKRPKAKIII